MMNLKRYLKNALRPLRDICYVAAGFAYDFFRYYRYAGWRRRSSGWRGYRAVKIYHRLEKSMSFKARRPGAGLDAVLDLWAFYQSQGKTPTKAEYQERVGVNVLREFLHTVPLSDPHIAKIKELSASLEGTPDREGGVVEFSEQRLLEGKLDDPERFFMSRYSVRDFREKPVDRDVIERALQLAMKSPSVCSRQAWHVYHIDEREIIDKALTLQNGNRGFGHEVPCLLIITADLTAFDTAGERYQQWIDGGMFSMSMLLALHSLGLGACCLNWSKGPVDDLQFRRMMKIRGEHTVMMMIAVGYASEELKVCCSARRPVQEVYTLIVGR